MVKQMLLTQNRQHLTQIQLVVIRNCVTGHLYQKIIYLINHIYIQYNLYKRGSAVLPLLCSLYTCRGLFSTVELPLNEGFHEPREKCPRGSANCLVFDALIHRKWERPPAVSQEIVHLRKSATSQPGLQGHHRIWSAAPSKNANKITTCLTLAPGHVGDLYTPSLGCPAGFPHFAPHKCRKMGK